MSDWHCGICKIKMEEVEDIKAIHGDIELPEIPGIRCPNCAIEFLLEEFVVNELGPTEEMLEGK